MNRSEKRFTEEAERRGYVAYHAGWPDFLVASVKEPESIFCVEVKLSPRPLAMYDWNGPSLSQEEMFPLLEAAGLPTCLSLDGRWIQPSPSCCTFIRDHVVCPNCRHVIPILVKNRVAKIRSTSWGLPVGHWPKSS